MAEISTIARPYAQALFRVACEANNLDDWARLLTEMAFVAGNADMLLVINHPKLSSEHIYEIFVTALHEPLSGVAQNFIRVLIDNRRLSVLHEIAAQFHVLKNTHAGAADAQITSAFPLSDLQLSELLAALEHKFKVKLKPKVAVDTALIGGTRVVVGDQVLDTSVRAQLEQMRTALLA